MPLVTKRSGPGGEFGSTRTALAQFRNRAFLRGERSPQAKEGPPVSGWSLPGVARLCAAAQEVFRAGALRASHSPDARSAWAAHARDRAWIGAPRARPVNYGSGPLGLEPFVLCMTISLLRRGAGTRGWALGRFDRIRRGRASVSCFGCAGTNFVSRARRSSAVEPFRGHAVRDATCDASITRGGQPSSGIVPSFRP